MNTLNEIVKTYATCLLWIIASGCAGFLIGYAIGYQESQYTPYTSNRILERTIYADNNMEYSLNGGLIGAAIGMLGALFICGIVVKVKGNNGQAGNVVRTRNVVGMGNVRRAGPGDLPPRVPRQ